MDEVAFAPDSEALFIGLEEPVQVALPRVDDILGELVAAVASLSAAGHELDALVGHDEPAA